MFRFVALASALASLAACATPDPSAFAKHGLRESLTTGSHIPGAATSDNGVSTTDTHDIERLETGGNGKDKNVKS